MSVDISNTVSRFFAAVDRCDWPAVQALMSDPFHADYSSYTGDPASDLSPAALTGAWAGLLPYFDAVHHQIGNLVIEQADDRAEVHCHGIASHFIADHPGGDLQWIVGTYDLGLVKIETGWVLDRMCFNFKYASGNAALAAEAQRRAEAHTP